MGDPIKKILALDISTSSGYAVLQSHNGDISISAKGTIINPKKVEEYGKYPFNYLDSADSMASRLFELVEEWSPDAIILEETNKAKSRYTQKILEFIHCMFLNYISHYEGLLSKVFYVNTSDWRKKVGVELTKEEKKQNAKLSKAKSKAGGKITPAEKKAIGIKGRINKKHVAVRIANETFKLELKAKDDDIADALCLGLAFIKGVETCDGKTGNKRKSDRADKHP